MTIKGVMFDFSQTLFRIKDGATWLRQVVRKHSVEVAEERIAEYGARLETVGALPGGPDPQAMPPRLEPLWQTRDLNAERHRAAYTGLAELAGLPWPELVGPLYDHHSAPEMWQAYPDARPALEWVRERGMPVAVVSNIGWDLRPIFRAHGLDELVDVYVLSLEHGVQKPDAGLFRIACEGLGLPPENVLMVGDSPAADGGAAALGCRVHLVQPLPVDQRPDALLAAVRRL